MTPKEYVLYNVQNNLGSEYYILDTFDRTMSLPFQDLASLAKATYRLIGSDFFGPFFEKIGTSKKRTGFNGNPKIRTLREEENEIEPMANPKTPNEFVLVRRTSLTKEEMDEFWMELVKCSKIMKPLSKSESESATLERSKQEPGVQNFEDEEDETPFGPNRNQLKMSFNDLRQEVISALQTEKDIRGRDYSSETVDELMKRYKNHFLKDNFKKPPTN